jgi:hypothetical protein
VTRRFFALLSITCFCFAAGAGVSFVVDRLTTEPPESWCPAACARWQMAGCEEGRDICLDLNCMHAVSCIVACESWPHSYPTGQCVADPPAGTGSMQTCEEIRNTCG